jgi:hypothetical protein
MYGKLFRQMFHGTLATVGPWQAIVTFQQFIILADQDGTVDMTPESISRETTIPLEVIKAGIEALERADPDSRTPDEEGRRIIRLNEHRSWGWRITNYLHYRQLHREEDRREYHRKYWHDKRSPKLKALNSAQQPQPNQPKHMQKQKHMQKKEEDGPAVSSTPPSPSFLGDENEGQIPARKLVALDAAFSLPKRWGEDAEALGWPRDRIIRLGEKFRQYYVSGKGAETKLTLKGWRQKWSNWLTKEESYL